MKLWISGDVDYRIGDHFRIIINIVEDEINRLFEKKNYGDAIQSWDIIFIIREDAAYHPEMKFNRKTKETDIRWPIDFRAFSSANSEYRKKLIVEDLKKSLLVLSEKYHLEDLDIKSLLNDIEATYES